MGYPPLGRRIVKRQRRQVLDWDQRKLRYIAEIAQRVPLEGVGAVAKDFWRRGIKDRWKRAKYKA